MSNFINAGGGVMWRPSDQGTVEVLLVHRPNYDDWTFPKGKQDEGEDIRRTARREVAEETNLHCRLGKRLGTIEYQTAGGSDKTVHMWAMAYAHGTFKPNSEVDSVEWLPATKVAKRLTYQRDKEFYNALGKKWWQPKRRILLIRHTEAGLRRTWTGDDKTRPLSPTGRAQAIALRDRFADTGIERIISSPFVRCVQSVEPLSAATGIEIEKDSALAEGADPKATAKLLGKLAGERVAVSTHGPVITDVMDHFVHRGMELSHPFDTKKGSTWKLRSNADQFTKAAYEPPPSV